MTPTEQLLRDALDKIKDIVVGDAHPHWRDRTNVYAARGKIADLCDEASAATSQQAEGEPKPFMYGIQEPNGSPYMDELCVSGDEGDLDDVVENLNDHNEDGEYKVVALYLAAPLPAQQQGQEEPRNEAGETPTEHAHRWATELAISMAKKFFPEVTQWKPLPDLLGVITQIDNMTTGLVRAAPPSQAPEPAQQEAAGAKWCKVCEEERNVNPCLFCGTMLASLPSPAPLQAKTGDSIGDMIESARKSAAERPQWMNDAAYFACAAPQAAVPSERDAFIDYEGHPSLERKAEIQHQLQRIVRKFDQKQEDE